jgi:phosphoribosylformimino-5-aminoimidazole carboxamide ribotide isomerase
MHLIPAIDLRDGHCVRLLHGNFEAETRYPTDPETLLIKYRNFGADWLHIVDLDGARGGTLDNRALILRLAEQKAVKLQVGGGLRNTAALAQVLDAGVARAVVGSAALTQAEQVQAWLKHFGPDRLTLAFDVGIDEHGVPRVMTHGWQQQSEHSLWSAVESYIAAELKHVLCTDVGRDPHIEWQASGGIRNAHDLHALAEAGASAAISGKALLEDLIPVEELQPFLPNA